MTRKEVIDELQKAIDLIKQNGKDWLDERDIPILQMAITALELSDSIMLQLDCKMFHDGVNVDNTVSDETTDIIYRQAAIDAMINSRSNADVTLVPGSYTNGWRDGRKFMLDELLQVVFELPPAQPDNSCDGCRYENADDGVLVPCGFCKRSHPDNYERRTDETD